MSEDNLGIPSIFQVIRESFPPGAELIEVVTPDGQSFSGDKLKAIEWQEQKMRNGELNPKFENRIDSLVEQLSDSISKPKPHRVLKSLFKFRHGKIMICNDDTVWFLSPESGSEFERCGVDILPRVPQGE